MRDDAGFLGGLFLALCGPPRPASPVRRRREAGLVEAARQPGPLHLPTSLPSPVRPRLVALVAFVGSAPWC